MRRLTKRQLDEIDTLHQAILQTRDRLNSAVKGDGEDVDEAREGLLNAFEEARTWLNDIYGEQESYYESRSEAWQIGERGDAYSTWMEAFRSDQLDDPVIDAGKPVVVDVSLLEDLPESP